MPSTINRENEILIEDKNKIWQKYIHIFVDVEKNCSRSARSYYESHHRSKSLRNIDIQGDVTNLKFNSIILTEKPKNIDQIEEDSWEKIYFSSQMTKNNKK